MQTILGAGGIIGNETAKALIHYTKKIRLASRHPKPVNETDEVLKTDLTVASDVDAAVSGSEIVYLTAGFKYNTKVWENTWPHVMKNVLDACKKHGAKLVFFDNIYMYHPKAIPNIREDSRVDPVSKKGKVRARIARMIMDEVEKGNVEGMIVRAADFYGPGAFNVSVLIETVFKNLSAGKKAYWLGSSKNKHAYTYTPDAGKATALLGNTPDAYNQVWHLPTDPDAMTGDQWVEAIAAEMNVKPGIQQVPKFMVRMLGLFDPTMREFVEMMYQYEQDYIFNSSKFNKRFKFKTTSYSDGIKEIVKADFSKKV